MGGLATKGEKSGSFHENYKLGGKTLQGEFSQVRVCRYVRDAEKSATDVSVKVLDLRRQDRKQVCRRTVDKNLLKNAHKEAVLWKKLGAHKNVLRLLDAQTSPGLYFFITEKVEYGFLYVLERMPVLDEQTIARFLRDALHGLQHMHGKNMVHCNINPDSFVCADKPLTLKLSGYGCLVQMQVNQSVQVQLKGEAGVPAFMSPEMLGARHYDQKTDLWSLGVVAYVLLFGQFPYKSPDRTVKGLKEAIRHGKPEPSFEPWKPLRHNSTISPDAVEFCHTLLNRHPLSRVGVDEALALAYMEGADEQLPEFEDGYQSLVPMLCGALKAGAFYSYLCSDEPTDLDFLLSFQQFHDQGPIQPWTKARQQKSLLKEAMEKQLRGQASGDLTSSEKRMNLGLGSSGSFGDLVPVAAPSPNFRASNTFETLAAFSGQPLVPDDSGSQPLGDHAHRSRGLGGSASRSFGLGDADEPQRAKTPHRSNRHRPSTRRGESASSVDAPDGSADPARMQLIENTDDAHARSADAAAFQSNRNTMSNSMSMAKFRRSATGNALTGGEASHGTAGPARGMLTRSGSKEVDIFKDLHAEIHPEDLAVAKSMQKGLSSHALNRGMSKALDGNDSDEEHEQRMTPRKSKQEMVEQSKDSSNWIHGFY